MSDAIGSGVIELSADSSKLNATINDARQRLKGLGDAGKESAEKSSASIDRYIKGLITQNATLGKSARETALYKQALKGATDEQLKAINAQHQIREAYERHEKVIARVKVGLAALAAAAVAAAIGSIAAFQALIKSAGDFQDLAERTGDTAENLASLAVSAKVGGVEMDAVGAVIIKLNKNLSGVDDESKDAGKALAALGLNIQDIKGKSGADQLEAIGKALNGFGRSAKDSEVLIALMGKSAAEQLPFLLELGKAGGRQNILTQTQIELADDYSDRQAKLRAQLSLYAESIATKMLPAINSISERLIEFAKDEKAVEGATTLMHGALEIGINFFQAMALVGSDVAFVFRTLVREIGFVPDALAKLKNADFKGILNLSDEIDAAAKKDRERLDAFQARIVALGKPKPNEWDDNTTMLDGMPEPQPPKKKPIIFTPTDPAAAAAALAARKAQTELDIDIIRRESDAVLNTYQNADRILQARHAASLIDEKTYYEAKAELIRLDADEQARALAAEIKTLEDTKLVGKDRIANERKLVEARAKLAKVRENEAVNLDINGGDEAAGVRKIAQAYVDAATAAQIYIDTINRQNARVVAGVGRGKEFRANQEGINGIEDKLLARKNELDSDLRRRDITPEQYAAYLQVAQDTYRKEVQAFDDRTKAISAAQADGFNGMTEALQNYADEARNVAGQTEAAFGNALGGLEDQFVQLAATGKTSFRDLLQSIQADIVRVGFKSLIGNFIDGFGPGLGKLFGRTPTAAKPTSGLADALGAATGAAGDATAAAGQAAQTAALAASTAAMTAQTASSAALTASETAAASAIALASSTSASALAALSGAASAAASALAAVGAGSAASSGTDFISSLAGVAGGRAVGGPVSPGGMYRVNESGPELLSVAGKEYLMMGQQGGAVMPVASGAGGGGDTYLNVSVAPPAGASRATALQFGAAAGRQMQLALKRNG